MPSVVNVPVNTTGQTCAGSIPPCIHLWGIGAPSASIIEIAVVSK